MLLKEIRTLKKISQQMLADYLSISRSTISMWESGYCQPDHGMLIKIAEYFDVSVDYLLGRNIETKRDTSVKVPVLGYVRAGIPMEAITDILDYEEISLEMASRGEYFALQIKGDSMAPVLLEKDVIIIRKQPDVESGEIAVVLVNGDDATVKKLHKHDNGISLVPINPAYSPSFFSKDEIANKPVIVIGKMVELRRKF